MEIKVPDTVIKRLVANHISSMTQKRVLPKDVHLFYDHTCEEVTHAYTFIDDKVMEVI